MRRALYYLAFLGEPTAVIGTVLACLGLIPVNSATHMSVDCGYCKKLTFWCATRSAFLSFNVDNRMSVKYLTSTFSVYL